MQKSLIATLTLGTALLLAAPASAQTSTPSSTTAQPQPPPGPGYGRMGRGMGQGMRHGMMRGRGMGHGSCSGMMGMGGGRHGMMTMMHYPDGTLAFLKTELKIKDSQTKQWDAFAHALRSTADAAQKMRAQHWSADRPQTLKAMLERRETRAAMHLESMRTMSAALIPLYDSLDAQQKQTADGLFMPCRRMGSGMGPGMTAPAPDADDDDGAE